MISGLTIGHFRPGHGKTHKSSSNHRASDVAVDQIQADVYSAIVKNAQAKTEKEWETSGFTPPEIIRNLRALKSVDAWRSFCHALISLRPTELALFEEEIDNPKNAESLPCRATLQGRLTGYWANQQRALQTRFGNPKSHFTSEAKASASDTELVPGQVTVTFEGGPNPRRTTRILRTLQLEGIHAAFFEPTQSARENPVLIQRIVAQGHSLGTMGMTRTLLTTLDMKNAEEDISNGQDSLGIISGHTVSLFRFPYGESTDSLDHYIETRGLHEVPGTLDAQDWKIRDTQALLESVLKQIDQQQGGIISLRDRNEQTALILPYLLAEIQKRNLTPVALLAPTQDHPTSVAGR